MTPTLEKIPTWLPVFPGFYNTIFDADFEAELYNLVESGELPDTADEGDLLAGWDNAGYENAVVACICAHMPRYFPKDSGVIGCKFERVVSPKEYNFVNDSANVTFELDMAVFGPWIKEYLKANENEWAEHLRCHYQSRDGFCSHYSYAVDDWDRAIENMINGVEIKADRTFHRHDIGSDHLLGRLLEFVLLNEDEDIRYSMYSDVNDSVYVGEFINLDEVKARLTE